MLTNFLSIFILALSAWFLWYNRRKQTSTLPPGPFAYPIVGNLFQILTRSKYPAVALDQLGRLYGPVMTLKIGTATAIAFTGHEAVKEILKHDSTADRAWFPVIKERIGNKNLGIVFAHGKNWQATRKFTIKNLKEFGFGKSLSMDVFINEEVSKYVNFLSSLKAKHPDGVVSVKESFNIAFLNTLWRLVTGKPYNYDDPQMLKLLHLQDEFTQSTDLMFTIPDVYPFLREWFPNWTVKAKQVEACKNIYEFGQQVLQEHRHVFQIDKDREPQGFLDVFIDQIEKNSNDPVFTDDNCIFTVLDLLLAGSDTSSHTMSFGILYMLLHPNVQEKVRNEIDLQIPPDEPIVMAMKQKLPYTSATLLEILRYSTVIPIPTARAASEDFYFRNFFIKKGTPLFANIQSHHFDNSVWGDAHTFRPERFLNEDGKVDTKVADMLIGFGGGKRMCMGISVAEASMFIFFATLIRTFQFAKVDNEPEPSIEPVSCIVYRPQPFNVKIIDRTK